MASPPGLNAHACPKLRLQAATIACVTPHPGQGMCSNVLIRQRWGMYAIIGRARNTRRLESSMLTSRCMCEGTPNLLSTERGQRSISTIHLGDDEVEAEFN